MTQEVPEGQPSAQPPPGWPYGDPPAASSGVPPGKAVGAEPPRPPKPPVSKGWWFLGVGLIVAAVVTMLLFIGLAVAEGVTVFNGATDVQVPGQSQVDLPPDEKRMLYARPGAEPTCTVTDTDGTDLPLTSDTSVSISINGDDWVGVGRFPTGSGHVLLTCEGADGVVRVGHVFGGTSFVVKILLAVFLPILLAFAGATVLTVTGVRHYRRRS